MQGHKGRVMATRRATKKDDDEYGKDGDTLDDDDEYAGGGQTTKKNTRTNQKHAGLTGERRDMRRNRQGARWECELIVLGRSIWDSVNKTKKQLVTKNLILLASAAR